MISLDSLRAGLSVAAWFIIAATCMNAQIESPREAINIVPVHGAWADGSSWSKVIPRLRERGFIVTAVQLRMTSIADDVQTTERALALQNGPVLLVGHSYGGVVITEAGGDPKVTGLLFVAAYAPG
jgi:pimeloyl-ACP methyl ester carboxylesterase